MRFFSVAFIAWSFLSFGSFGLAAEPSNVVAAPQGQALPPELAAAVDQPDVYVRKLFDVLYSGDAHVAWLALPPGYQADVTALKNDFAAKIDPELWEKAFVVGGRFAEVFKTKREMFLKSQVLATMPDDIREPMIKSWDSYAHFFETFMQSEIKTHAGLKKMEPAAFVAATLTPMLRDIRKISLSSSDWSPQWEEARRMKFTLLNLDGDVATLRTTVDGEPKDVLIVKKVDGRWLPAELVDWWEAGIAKAKTNLAGLAIPPQLKPEIMRFLGLLETHLDKMLAAKDQAEFDARQIQIALTIQAAFGPKGPVEDPEKTPTQPVK